MAYINRSIFPIGVNKLGTDTIFLAGKISNLMPLPQTGSVYYQRTKHLKSNISLQTQNVFSYNPEINTKLPEPPPLPITTNYSLRLLFNNIANADIVIGGDASVVGDWNTFFDLPNYGNPFTSVAIVGNEVQLTGGYNIETKFRLFFDNGYLVEVNDDGALVILGDESFAINFALTTFVAQNVTTTISENLGNYGVFGNCYILETVTLPKCVNLGAKTVWECEVLPSSGLTLPFDQITSIASYTFQYCYKLTEVNYPVATSIGEYAFSNIPTSDITGITSINLPLATNIDNHAFSAEYYSVNNVLTSINIASCTNLGGNTNNNGVFTGITSNNITLTLPSALMTCNAGNPDGDIQYLQSSNTVTVITV
jgi:hypothetical protein